MPLHPVYGCFHATSAELSSWLYDLQNIKYLLPDSLQKKFADTWSIVKEFLEEAGEINTKKNTL